MLRSTNALGSMRATDAGLSNARRSLRAGLTLLELVVVIAILAIVVGFVVPCATYLQAQGRTTAVTASLTTVRDAIVGTADKPGYLTDTGQMPTTLRDLFLQPASVPSWNRDTALGWRGPYLLNANGQYKIGNSSSSTFVSGAYPAAYGYSDGATTGDPVMIDPWGNAIVLQYPINTTTGLPDPNSPFGRLISAGPDGVIQTQPGTDTAPYPQLNSRGDDVVLFITHSDSP